MNLTAILKRDVTALILSSVLALPALTYEPPLPRVASSTRSPSVIELFKSRVESAARSSVILPSFSADITVSSAIQSVVSYTLPTLAPNSVAYSASTPVRYEKRSEEYVHVPSWVTVSRAPFTQFGRSLFGLAVPSTGSVYVREDLQGKEFTEVLFHEVLHTLYPSCSESDVRSMVLARFGADAPIHTSVCRP